MSACCTWLVPKTTSGPRGNPQVQVLCGFSDSPQQFELMWPGCSHTSNHSRETRPDTVSVLGISTSTFLLAPNSPARSSIIGMGILQSQVGAQTAQVTQGPMSARIQGSEGLAPWPFFGLVRASALVTLSLQGLSYSRDSEQGPKLPQPQLLLL